MKLTPGDARQPVRWASYAPGIDDPDPSEPMGPTLAGEWMWPVVVERHPDRTRVGFSFAAPPRRAAS